MPSTMPMSVASIFALVAIISAQQGEAGSTLKLPSSPKCPCFEETGFKNAILASGPNSDYCYDEPTVPKVDAGHVRQGEAGWKVVVYSFEDESAGAGCAWVWDGKVNGIAIERDQAHACYEEVKPLLYESGACDPKLIAKPTAKKEERKRRM